MKQIVTISALALAICLLLSACSKGITGYFELEGGVKSIDFLEFVSDSTCRFIAPGSMEMVCPYEIVDDSYIVVHVAPMSVGVLNIVNDKTLEGQVPFFEGTWKKVRKPRGK